MSRKTWRDLARQQSEPAARGPAVAAGSLQQLSGQVPGLQRLLQQRQTLEQQMQALGGQASDAGASRVYPVASAAERRAEQSAWEQRRAQLQGNSSETTPQQQWQQQRESQLDQARTQANNQQRAHLGLLQRLDDRVEQARNNALSRLQQQRSERLREPLLRPLTDRLNTAPSSTESGVPTLRDPTTLRHFDDRYARRQQRLLGVETGPLEQLEQRSQQAQQRRLEERREARRNERQQSLLQQRAAERRSQRPQLSTD